MAAATYFSMGALSIVTAAAYAATKSSHHAASARTFAKERWCFSAGGRLVKARQQQVTPSSRQDFR